MVLSPGDPVPAVTSRNQHGDTVEIDTEGPTVVYFYPRDDTPGCTIEAQQFERERDSYAEAGVNIIGVSTDDVDSHAEFSDKYDLSFDLLADPEGELAEVFDVPIKRGATVRTTFVIIEGAVHNVYEQVDPDGHARTVLNNLLEDGVVSLNLHD